MGGMDVDQVPSGPDGSMVVDQVLPVPIGGMNVHQGPSGPDKGMNVD